MTRARNYCWMVVFAVAASICSVNAVEEAIVREELKSWLTRPGVTGLLYGPMGENSEQLAANEEAKKLPPNGAPIVIEMLENATTPEERLGAICLLSFYLRVHPVDASLKARARQAVVTELGRRPLKATAVTNVAIKFLGMYGEYEDLSAIEPYIVSGYVQAGHGQDIWEMILKRAGRTSPPPPSGVPEGGEPRNVVPSDIPKAPEPEVVPPRVDVAQSPQLPAAATPLVPRDGSEPRMITLGIVGVSLAFLTVVVFLYNQHRRSRK